MKIVNFLMILAILCISLNTISAAGFPSNSTQMGQANEAEMIDNLKIGLKNLLANTKDVEVQYQKFNKSDKLNMYKSTISFDTYKHRLYNFLTKLTSNDKTTRGFVIYSLGGGLNRGKVKKIPQDILIEKLSNRYIEITIMQEDILATLNKILSNENMLKISYEKFVNAYPKIDIKIDPEYNEYVKNLNSLRKKLSNNINTIDGLILPSLKDMIPGATQNTNWAQDIIVMDMVDRIGYNKFVVLMGILLNDEKATKKKYEEYRLSFVVSPKQSLLNFDDYVERLKKTTKLMRKYSTIRELTINNIENFKTIDNVKESFSILGELTELVVNTNTFLKGNEILIKYVKKLAKILGTAIGLLLDLIFLLTGVCLYCLSEDCNTVLNCVMEQQRDSLAARLDDLKTTIEANTKQTKHQTKIIKQELDHYVALLARVKKENEILSKAVFLSKKIRDSESLGVQINAIGKGK